MPGERLKPPPPIVQAFLLADHVFTDPHSGKSYILGTYNRFVAGKFPHTIRHLWLWLALTGGHGATTLRVRIVDMDEQHNSLLESTRPVMMTDPNGTFYLPICFTVVFPAPGIYRIQVFADNDFLRELRLELVSRQENLPSPGEP